MGSWFHPSWPTTSYSWTFPYGLPFACMFLTVFILHNLPIPSDTVHLQQGLVWLGWPRTLGDSLGFVVGF